MIQSKVKGKIMDNLKKYFLMVLILSISYYSLYADTSSEVENFMEELNTKNNEYYSGARFVRTSEAKEIIERVEKSTTLTGEEKLYIKIEAYALWTNTTIASGTFEEDYPILKDIYNNIKKQKIFKKGSTETYTAFTDFANAMIPLAMFNNKLYWYVFVVDGGNYVKIALIKDPSNTKASVLYGMNNSIPVNYLTNNQYSKSLKFMKNTDGLENYMVFRSYIYKSMLYMKVNKTENAFDELSKAENMYPDSMYVYMLKASYAKGGTGFASPDSGGLDDIFK